MKDNDAFDRSKIYEKLDYVPEPFGYKAGLPWVVQQQIAATNGIQYVDRIGKLNEYPEFELPVSMVEEGLMLDIGTGWGRWLIAGQKKGYTPIGADIRLEFCKTALNTMRAKGINGYTVVADLQELPFQDKVFDLVWSFSVIQHTHKDRMLGCLNHIHRILKAGAYTKLEFPNAFGFHNYFGPYAKSLQTADDFQSWEVRYYSIEEYRKIFMSIFHNFKYQVHSMLGIGVLKEDLKYVSLKNKLLCSLSLTGSLAAKIITPLKTLCDSVYVQAVKEGFGINQQAIMKFTAAHNSNPADNLNIIHLLRCPISGEALHLSDAKDRIINTSHNISYPVIDNIPIMIKSEATVS
jgi:ubiquinone/menaquinone biosynthesis C-methylase UbiE/uncharacterized protein YbaR (Trm112 family)